VDDWGVHRILGIRDTLLEEGWLDFISFVC
jgi:hypothetical protein